MKTHRIPYAIATILVATMTFTARTATAQEWKLTIAPYIWMTAFDGKIAVRGQKQEVDASFSDILDKSDSVLSFNADIKAHNGRFGFLFAPSYMQMGVDNLAHNTALQADFTTDLLFLDLAAEYRLIDWPMQTSGGEETSATLDAYAGTRYSRLSVDLDFDNGALGHRDRDEDWWDPIVGLDANVDLCPHAFLMFRGDVGGFSVSSDFMTNDIAAIGWRFNLFGIDAAVRAGYRVMYEDYDHGGFEWRMTTHGPILGFMSTWG